MSRRALAVAASASLVAMILVVGPTAVSAAPTPAPAHAPQARQRFIVRTDSSASTTAVARTVRAGGGRVDNLYAKALTGLSAEVTPDQAADLSRDGRVDSVTPDRRFHSTDVQTNPTWGLDRIDQRSASLNGSYRYTTTGVGVTAFVVDTGIRLTHSEFGGRASSGHDFADDDDDASDCAGHGTHVSGTIGGSTYGVAKRVKLVSVRVLDCDGSGWAGDIINGIDWVIAHKPAGPAVVNLSIGGGAYPLLDQAVQRLVAAGITVVVAAGNEGTDACTSSPARAPQAITVAATDLHDTRPSWSNYGRCVDLFAPGLDVRSASNTSDTASEVMSGTSMAAPHVTGLAARYLQTHPKATPAQTAAALLAAATPQVVLSAESSPNRLAFAEPPVVAPGLPTKVVASVRNETKSASVSWAAPRDNGGKAITSYRVSRDGQDSRGAGAITVTVSSGSRKHTFAFLRKGSSYTLSVRAVNEVGKGPSVSTKLVKLG